MFFLFKLNSILSPTFKVIFKLIQLSYNAILSFDHVNFLHIFTQTYDELIALAEKGNPYNVHYTNADLMEDVQDKSQGAADAGGLYAKAADMKEQSYVYCMGKAAGKSRGESNTAVYGKLLAP